MNNFESDFQIYVDGVYYDVCVHDYIPAVDAWIDHSAGAGYGDAEPPEPEYLTFSLLSEDEVYYADGDEVKGAYQAVSRYIEEIDRYSDY
jgi:hypothetical protein